VGGWEGNHLALGDSCCELSPTLLGGVRGVGGVSGGASSREMSWPNKEKLKDSSKYCAYGSDHPCVVSLHCLRISITSSTLLRIPWIEDTAFQEFSINFITELKALWAETLRNNT